MPSQVSGGGRRDALGTGGVAWGLGMGSGLHDRCSAPASVPAPCASHSKHPMLDCSKYLSSIQTQKQYGHGSAKPSLTLQVPDRNNKDDTSFHLCLTQTFQFQLALTSGSLKCALLYNLGAPKLFPCAFVHLLWNWEWVFPTPPWYFEDKYAKHREALKYCGGWDHFRAEYFSDNHEVDSFQHLIFQSQSSRL